jgi:hypothetical protein
MDNYPDHLIPERFDTWDKEPFQTWWKRAQAHFPNVPRNVARQWIYRHWSQSRYRWLPTSGAVFTLERWQPQQITDIKIHREGDPPYDQWGDHLLSLAQRPKGYRYRPSVVMAHRHCWPAPPIVLDHTAPLPFATDDDFPGGYVLVEGNRRTAMAKALAKRGLLKPDLPVWVLRY